MENFTLTNSTVSGFYQYGMYTYFHYDAQIIGNTFIGGNSSSAYSTFMYYMNGSSAGKMRFNSNKFIKNQFLAIYFATASGGSSTTNRSEFHNNVVHGDFANSSSYVAFLNSGSYWEIYNNTLASNRTNSPYCGLYTYGSNNVIKNNNFIASGGAIMTTTSTTDTVDYNNYYNWTGSGTASSSAGLGSNSVSINQGWKSLTDLDVTDACVNGVYVGVTTDVNGKTRANPPDMGAYEATSGSNDAGVSEILSPKTPLTAGTQVVKLVIKNYGSNSITAVDANYKVGTASTVTGSLSLATGLAACTSDTVTISTGFSVSSGCHNFKAWTSSPNGNSDGVNANDTSFSQIGVGMSGTFTIGSGSGADFSSIQDALNAMACGGVSGTTVFKLDADTITGQISIPNISGASSTAKVIFKGAGITKTMITFSQTSSSGDMATLTFNESSWVEFRDMTIVAAGTSYGWGVNFRGSNNCAIRNCHVLASTTTTSSSIIPIVIGGGDGVNYYSGGVTTFTTIDSCDVQGGYFVITAYATSQTSAMVGVSVTNSTISNGYYYGFYNRYVDGITFSNNILDHTRYNYQYTYAYYQYNYQVNPTLPNIFTNNTITCHGYGAYFFYTANHYANPGLIANNMLSSSSGFYGIYLYGSTSSTYYSRNWGIYHNTISLNNSSSSTRYAMYMYYVDSTDVRNNIFNVEGGSSSSYAYYNNQSQNGSTEILDYNVYNNPSGNYLLYVAGARTAAQLNTYSSNSDANSSAMTPSFISSTDLHISDACFPRGASISAITTDIDGDTRASSPHIGADEVPTPALDAGISVVLSPVGQVSSGSQTVTAVVRNYGTTALTSVKVTYQVGSGTAVTETFSPSSSISSCSVDTFTFSSTFNHTAGCARINVWTSAPNTGTDGSALNDTATSQFGIPMVGAYTIGGSSPDFTDFFDAQNGLNCSGISGPVTFNVRSGTYVGQVQLTDISGMSSTNTVTFQSASGNATMPRIEYNATGTSDNYVVQFNNTGNFIFDGIHFLSKNGSYGRCIEFIGANSNITVKNGKVEGPSASTSSNYMALVYDNTSTSNMSEDVIFDNNMMLNGSQAFYVYGGHTSALQDGWEITNNTIKDFAYYGAFFYYMDNLKFNGNDVSTTNTYTTGPIATYFQYCDGAMQIMDNRIDVHGGYGMYMYYNDATSSAPSLIANNFIHVGQGSNASRGIYSWYSRYQHFYHNSVNITSTTYSSSYAAGYFYYSSSSYAGNELKNNIFANNGDGYALYLGSSTYNYITSDYNCIYSSRTSGSIIYAAGSYSSVAQYSSARGKDGNSIDDNPKFYSETDLHCISGALDSAGTSLSSVVYDIDGETRRSANPSIGADEYTAIDNDGGISAILSPLVVCSSNTATVRLYNYGEAALTSCKINWTVDGTTQTQYSFSGSVASGGFTDVSIGSFSTSSTAPVTIVVWTTLPNNVTDLKPQNDTSSTTIGLGMSGTFTVGGSSADYPSVSAALSDLEANGLCGPVVLNVNQGTYTEQVVVSGILNAGPTNTLTIQSNPSNTAMPVFEYTAGGFSDNYIFRMQNASYVIIKNLHLIAKNTNYGRTIELIGSNDFITVTGCTLESPVANTTSNYMAVFYDNTGTGNMSHNVTLMNNTIMNGAYSIYAYGGNTSDKQINWIVKNNTCTNFAYMGMYSFYQDSTTYHDNVFSTTSTYTTNQYGMYCYYNAHYSIQRNNISGLNGGYGMYLYFCYSTVAKPNMLTNNYVQIGNGSLASRGIYVYYGSYNKISHNTFHVTSSYNSTTYAAGYIYVGSSYFLYEGTEMRNNIFANTGGGYAYYCYYPSYVSSDYNNIFSTSSGSFIYGFSTYNSLASFTSATTKDSNSVSINPDFSTTPGYQVNNIALHQSGMGIGIIDDITGDSRDTTAPTIGAFEMDPDIMVVSVGADTLCGPSNTAVSISVTLTNKGDVDMSDIPVSIVVDAGSPSTEVIAGPLAVGATGTFALSTTVDLSGTSANTITVTATNADVNSSNNSASTSVPYWPLPTSAFTHADSCYGDAMSFTNSSSITSGSIASSSWAFGDGNVSTSTSPTNMYSADGNYTVMLSSTSANGCSDTIWQGVTVLTDIVAGAISADQTICYGFTPAGLNNATGPSGSAGTFSHQWQWSTDNSTWSDISGATNEDYSPGALNTTTYFRRGASTDIGCGPNYTSSVKITVYDMLVAGVIGSDQTICYNATPTTVSQTTAPTGGNGAWTYQWQKSLDNSSWSDLSGFTTTSYSPAALKVTTYYRLVATGGMSCGSVESNSVKITVYADLNAGVIGSSHSICPKGTPALISESFGATGGDKTYTYQWQSSTNGTSWSNISGATSATYQETASLTSAIHYRRMTTSGSGCGTKITNSVSIIIAPLPKSAFILANHCFNDVMPVTNNSTVPSGSITGYLWDLGDGNTSTAKTPSHVYAASGFKTVKLKVTTNIGCTDSSTSKVNVSNVPTPAFRTVFDCSTDSMNFKNTTSVNCGKISGFSWDFGDGSTSTDENPTHKYASFGSYTVKFKIALPGGFTDSLNRVVTLHKDAVSNFNVDDVCFGDSARFVNTTTNASSYKWDFDDNNTSTKTNPVHFYRVTGTYSVRLIATDGNACNDTTTKSIVVKVRPSAYFATDDRCVNANLPFDNGTYYAHTYVWDFGDGSSSTSTSTKVPHAYASAGTYNVVLYANNNNGCKDTAYETVVVFANPVPSFTFSGACKGEKVSFTNNSTGQKLNNWSFGDGSFSTATNPTNAYKAIGSYTVKLVLTSVENCTDSTSRTVAINDVPSADFSATSVCLGSATDFTNNSSGGSGTVTYAWDFGDGSTSTATSPSHTYAAAGKYTVQLTASGNGSCDDATTMQVEVFDVPTVSINTASTCLGSAIGFSANTTNTSTYAWSFGDGNTSTSNAPSHTYSTAGSYTVSLTVTSINGCTATTTATATANPIPVAGFTANKVCVGSNTSFNNTSSIASGTMTYAWAFGDGATSTGTSPTHNYSSKGTYTVTLTVTSGAGCSHIFSSNIEVYGMPTADFTGTNVCVGSATSFANYSASATSHAWAFGDGNSSSLANPSHTYKAAGTYVVTLTSSNANGCSDQKSVSVVVYADPTADFSTANGCVNTSISFSNSSSTGAYIWDFGDGYASTAANPSHTYKTAGSYTVSLKVSNSFGCKSEVMQSITIYAAPTAGFNDAQGCAQKGVSFTNTSSGASGYAWSFGDNGTSASANPSHTYTTAGTYSVKLTASNTNGCASTITKSVTISANPTVGFTAADACNGKQVAFTNSSSDGVNAWSFGDGATSSLKNPSHLYSASGTYTATLTVTSAQGCTGSMNRSVSVFPNPTASFSATPLCTGPSANFNNTSSISSGSINSSWNYGDGSTGGANTHTYTSAGTYNVVLTVTSNNGCVSTVAKSVGVYNAPSASFTAPSVCDGKSVEFFNTSGNTTASSWDFGDGASSTNASPTHRYSASGSYSVKLTASNAIGCNSVATNTVIVLANPTADFNVSNGCAGTSIAFTNNSGSAANSLWDFGDGASSNAMNPNHTYSGSGSKTIGLKVTSSNGCTDVTTKSIDIFARPMASFSTNNTCDGDLTQFINTSQNGNTFNWNFGDGNTSTNTNPTNMYAASGNYMASLVVDNANCSDTLTRNVAISPLPNSGFTFNRSGKTVDFTPTSAGLSAYDWDFDDGSTSTMESPIHDFDKAVVQTFNVCLRVTDQGGCQSQSCNDVNIDLLGVDDHSTLAFAIYPNPNKGNFTISLGQINGEVEIDVTDATGRLMHVVNTDKINTTYQVQLENFATGIYMVNVKNGDATTSQRIMVTR